MYLYGCTCVLTGSSLLRGCLARSFNDSNSVSDSDSDNDEWEDDWDDELVLYSYSMRSYMY